MQLGNASKTVVHTTPDVNFRVDNATPSAQFTSLAWRVAGTSTWTVFPSLVCPVVSRPVGAGGVPATIEFRVSYLASAAHLLKTIVSGSGCGAGGPERLTAPGWSEPPTAEPNWPVLTPAEFDSAGPSHNPYDHWHMHQGDNTVIRNAVFSLPGAPGRGLWLSPVSLQPRLQPRRGMRAIRWRLTGTSTRPPDLAPRFPCRSR